jgi:hypothetical protein
VEFGGTVDFANEASLSISPPTIRQIFSQGKDGSVQCSNNTESYIDQSTHLFNIIEFCFQLVNQTTGVATSYTFFEREYNIGTPDHLGLSVDWPVSKYNYAIFEEEC